MADLIELARMAELRHGLLTTADLIAAGVDERQIHRWSTSGRLIRVAHGVHRVAGAPPTAEAEILAPVLVHGSGTWASHRTAAWLWGLPGFGRPGRVEVLRGHDRSNERSAARVHRSTRLPAHHVGIVRAVPVTSLPRTVFDLGGRVGWASFDRAVEAALRTDQCTVASLYSILAELGGRGRPGTTAMRRALEWRGREYCPTESELDLLGRAVLASITGIEWQVPLSDRKGYIRRVDGLHRSSGLVIEWDGAEYHDSVQQRELDVACDLRLRAMGHEVVRFRWADVTERPDEVRAEVVERIRPPAEAA